MNQKKTLATLYKMIEPGGGAVIVAEGGGYGVWTRKSDGWRGALNEVIKKYLGPGRRAGSGYYKVPENRSRTSSAIAIQKIFHVSAESKIFLEPKRHRWLFLLEITELQTFVR